MPLRAEDRERFDRHLRLPGFDEDAVQRLLDARVLVVGVGGLGGTAALHLAASGVGTLTIMDDDRVEKSNLHRQVLFADADVGVPKKAAAHQRLMQNKPRVHVRTRGRFTARDEAVLADHDLVLDGTDDPGIHHLLNDAALDAGVPLVAAGVHRYEGHVMTVLPSGPCLRCLHPEPAPPAECDVEGVLGPLCGILGAWQATEAVKVIAGVGRPIAGRVLLIDALEGRVEQVELKQRPGCVCAEGRRPLQGWILDVREGHERDAWAIPQSHHIPLDELGVRLAEVPRDQPVLVHCSQGARAQRAVRLLRQKGIDARVLAGARAWAVERQAS